jgi:hypothetical protein
VVPLTELTGENVALAPVGSPVAEKLTVFAKPAIGVMPIASVPLAPAVTLTLGEAGVKLKLAAAVITRFSVVVTFAAPDTPEMVKG